MRDCLNARNESKKRFCPKSSTPEFFNSFAAFNFCSAGHLKIWAEFLRVFNVKIHVIRIQTVSPFRLRLFNLEFSLILNVKLLLSFKNIDLMASSNVLSTSVSAKPTLKRIFLKLILISCYFIIHRNMSVYSVYQTNYNFGNKVNVDKFFCDILI